MKTFLAVVAWCVASGALVYLVTNPEGGLVFQGPGFVVALAVAGVGLVKHFAGGSAKTVEARDEKKC